MTICIFKQAHGEFNIFKQTKESNFDFLKPNPNCAMCDVVDDYVCFFCEDYQVQTSKDKLIGEVL